MAHLRMGEVVYQSEYGSPRIGYTSGGVADAKSYLSAQMYTDAVFNQDIRVIQTIINRVDGGLPKDTEIDEYQTLFGDCMNEILSMQRGEQLKVLPTDTVMMALCKSLFDIATTDIYYEIKADKGGKKWAKRVNPSPEKKQARDSAMRLVLERAGGKKAAIPQKNSQLTSVNIAGWIKNALPGIREDNDTQ